LGWLVEQGTLRLAACGSRPRALGWARGAQPSSPSAHRDASRRTHWGLLRFTPSLNSVSAARRHRSTGRLRVADGSLVCATRAQQRALGCELQAASRSGLSSGSIPTRRPVSPRKLISCKLVSCKLVSCKLVSRRLAAASSFLKAASEKAPCSNSDPNDGAGRSARPSGCGHAPRATRPAPREARSART
jgi:hypothetical protein